MSIWISAVRWLVVCTVASLLFGCAATPIAAEQKLTGQEGAVVLKLATNGRSEWDPAETLSSITIQRQVPAGTTNQPSDAAVTLVRTRAMTHTTAVFSGMVPPGRYAVLSAVGSSGDTTYTFPMGRMLSDFEVKTGEVSLLGTVLVQPLDGRRFNVGYVPPDAEMSGTLAQLFPSLAEQTRGRPVHSFELTPAMKRRVESAPAFKRLASTVYGLKLTDKGDGFAGSKVGKVLWRKAGERRWRELDVGSWKAVLTVRPYRNGLLVAGEEGLLRHSSDEGKTWVELAPPAMGLITAAEPLPNGKVLAMVRRDAQWSAYLADDALTGPWRKLGSFADERSFNVPWSGAVAVATGNRVGVMMPNGAFQVADGDAGTVERISTGLSMLGMGAMPDGMLVMQGAIVVRTTLISTDGGKTWIDLQTSRFVTGIAFADRQKVYAVAPIKPGVFPGPYGLMKSSDGGRSWVQSGEVPQGVPGDVRDLAVDRSDGSLLAFMRSGNIMRSADEGKTWDREH